MMVTTQTRPISGLEELPKDLLVEVLLFTGSRDEAVNLSLSSQALNQNTTAVDDVVWKALFERRFPSHIKAEGESYKQAFEEMIWKARFEQHFPSHEKREGESYKQAYKKKVLAAVRVNGLARLGVIEGIRNEPEIVCAALWQRFVQGLCDPWNYASSFTGLSLVISVIALLSPRKPYIEPFSITVVGSLLIGLTRTSVGNREIALTFPCISNPIIIYCYFMRGFTAIKTVVGDPLFFIGFLSVFLRKSSGSACC